MGDALAQARRPVSWRPGGTLGPVEVRHGDIGLELLDGHPPQIRAVVDELRQSAPEVAVVRSRLHLHDDEVALVGDREQVWSPGGQTGLPADHECRGPNIQFLDGQELRMVPQLLLQLVFVAGSALVQHPFPLARRRQHNYVTHLPEPPPLSIFDGPADTVNPRTPRAAAGGT